MLIVFLPFVIALSSVVHSGKVYNIIVGLYFAIFMVSNIVSGFSLCPRCRNFFFIGGWLTNPFTSHCMNCRLRIDGEPD